MVQGAYSPILIHLKGAGAHHITTENTTGILKWTQRNK